MTKSRQISDVTRLKLSVRAFLLLVAMAAFSACGGGGGGVSTPPPVSPPADTTPPTVSVSAPDAGTTFTSARNVTVSATANDDTAVSMVEFYRDGVLVSTDQSASFSFTWAIDVSDNGTFSWTAQAFDAAGNATTSDSVSLTVDIPAGSGTPDTTPPFNVFVNEPLDGTSYVSAGPVTVSATASDDVGVTRVEFYRDGVRRATDTLAPWNWTTQLTSASNGTYGLTARAYDEYGNATTSDSIGVSVDILQSGGTSPSSGTWLVTSDSLEVAGITDMLLIFDDNLIVTELSYSFNGTPRTFSGSALNRSDADVDADGGVDVEVDWGEDNGLTFGGTLNAARDVATGILAYTIIDGNDVEVGSGFATLIEQSGGGSAPDAAVPSVSITSPASGTTFSTATTVNVAATASDDVGVTKVEFYRDGVLRSSDASEPYTWAPSITAASNGTLLRSPSLSTSRRAADPQRLWPVSG